MRLVCPNCAAQYEVDDSAIPDKGRDVQCANCGNTWFQENDASHVVSPDDAIGVPHEAEEDDEDNETSGLPAGIDFTPPKTDPEVSKILREEAEHETQLRNDEERTEQETYDDAYSDESETEFEEASRDELQPAPRPDPKLSADGFPDINELNATLHPANEPRQGYAQRIPSETAPKRRTSSRIGFYLAILIALVLLAVYALGTQISEAFPEAASYIARFTILVDQARHGLATGFASLIDAVQNLLGNFL